MRLYCDGVHLAELTQKRERLVVAAHEHVLAVVHELAGLAIRERGRAAAEPRLRFDDEHACAVARETHGGAQAGEAGADHDDVVLRPGLRPGSRLVVRGLRQFTGPYRLVSHVRIAMNACRGRATRTRSEKTS